VKILIASTPATGHLTPLLSIGRILIAEGHEVVGLSGSALRERIEGIGAEFHPLPAGADFDLRDFDTVAPELKNIPPGLEWLRVAMERVFVDAIPAQHKGLQQVLRDFPADVVIGDDMIFRRASHAAARTALEAAPNCALWYIDFALAPRRPSATFYRPAARNHQGAAQGICGHLSRI
jgi:UDP:flavonoid glycosyltransferase YjiC (YdhE family)